MKPSSLVCPHLETKSHVSADIYSPKDNNACCLLAMRAFNTETPLRIELILSPSRERTQANPVRIWPRLLCGCVRSVHSPIAEQQVHPRRAVQQLPQARRQHPIARLREVRPETAPCSAHTSTSEH